MESPLPRTSNPNPDPSPSTFDILIVFSALKDVKLVIWSTTKSVSSFNCSSSTPGNAETSSLPLSSPPRDAARIHVPPLSTLFFLPGNSSFDHLQFLETLRYPDLWNPNLSSKREITSSLLFPMIRPLCFSLGDGACEPPLDSFHFFYKDCAGGSSDDNGWGLGFWWERKEDWRWKMGLREERLKKKWIFC